MNSVVIASHKDVDDKFRYINLRKFPKFMTPCTSVVLVLSSLLSLSFFYLCFFLFLVFFMYVILNE